ncbi:MAG: hypothetical protein RR482_00910 [Clostridia bacterium]
MGRVSITATVGKIFPQVEKELRRRATSACVILRNSQKKIFKGGRSGRNYGGHTASAPGEPPAIWHNRLNTSFRPIQYGGGSLNAGIETDVFYAGYLENGTPHGQMAERPFRERILNDATPQLTELYSRPFKISI